MGKWVVRCKHALCCTSLCRCRIAHAQGVRSCLNCTHTHVPRVRHHIKICTLIRPTWLWAHLLTHGRWVQSALNRRVKVKAIAHNAGNQNTNLDAHSTSMLRVWSGTPLFGITRLVLWLFSSSCVWSLWYVNSRQIDTPTRKLRKELSRWSFRANFLSIESQVARTHFVRIVYRNLNASSQHYNIHLRALPLVVKTARPQTRRTCHKMNKHIYVRSAAWVCRFRVLSTARNERGLNCEQFNLETKLEWMGGL